MRSTLKVPGCRVVWHAIQIYSITLVMIRKRNRNTNSPPASITFLSIQNFQIKFHFVTEKNTGWKFFTFTHFSFVKITPSLILFIFIIFYIWFITTGLFSIIFFSIFFCEYAREIEMKVKLADNTGTSEYVNIENLIKCSSLFCYHYHCIRLLRSVSCRFEK